MNNIIQAGIGDITKLPKYRRVVLSNFLSSTYGERYTYKFDESKINNYKYDIIVISRPLLKVNTIIKLKNNKNTIIYDRSDNWKDSDHAGDYFDLETIKLADIVVCSSDSLYNEAIKINKNTFLKENGCDFNTVTSNLSKIDHSMVYIGRNGNKIDWELIKALAIKYPDWEIHIYLEKNIELMNIPNIFYHKFLPLEELRMELSRYSLGLILLTDYEFCKGMFPLKFLEYVNVGIPTVFTNCPNIEKFSDVAFKYNENLDLNEIIAKKIDYSKIKETYNWKNYLSFIKTLIDDNTINVLNSNINSSDIKYIYKTDNTNFTVKWRMTNWCNFRCSYCIRKEAISKEKQTTQELVEKAKYIRQIINDIDKPVSIQLIGGEVTWFDLDTIIRELFAENVKKISITTNLSNSTEYYRNLYNLCWDNGIILKLTASFHEEFSKMDVYIKKVVDLNFVKPEMVITPDNIDIAKEFITKLKDNNISSATLDFDRTLPAKDVKYIKSLINNENFNSLGFIIETKDNKKLIGDKASIRRNLKFNSSIQCNNLKYMVYIDDKGDIYDTVCKYKKKLGSLESYKKDMLNPFWRKCPGETCSVCGQADFKFSEDI